MKSETYDFLFKVIIIGHDNSGKTCLLQRFTDDTFTDSYIPTIGADFRIKNINSSGKRIKAQIWDTAGQERFKNITSSYYRGVHGALIVYDVTNRSSFKQVENFLTDLEHYSGQSYSKVLVANKCDLHETRCVPTEEGESLAVINNMEYVETSAKLNDNVDKAFETLLSEIFKDKGKTQEDVRQQQVAPSSDYQTMARKGGAIVSEEESVATPNNEDDTKTSKELTKELKRVTKNMEKLEKSVKTMSKRIEDLEKKTRKTDSRKTDSDSSSTKSSLCLIV